MPKYTLDVSPELDSVIERLAAEQGTPKAQIFRRAVILMDYLDKEATTNNKEILLRNRDSGDAERIVFESHLGRLG